jgi:hypothetical protein
MPRGSLALGTSSAQRCLLFVPGFLVPPRAYTALLAPVADRVGRVIVLPPAASTVALMAGRHSPGEQARHVGEVARELQRTPGADRSRCWHRGASLRLVSCWSTPCRAAAGRGQRPSRSLRCDVIAQASWSAAGRTDAAPPPDATTRCSPRLCPAAITPSSLIAATPMCSTGSRHDSAGSSADTATTDGGPGKASREPWSSSSPEHRGWALRREAQQRCQVSGGLSASRASEAAWSRSSSSA